MDHSLALISQLPIDRIQIAQNMHEGPPAFLAFADTHLERLLLLQDMQVGLVKLLQLLARERERYRGLYCVL